MTVPFFGGPWDQKTRTLDTLPEVLAFDLVQQAALPEFDRGQTIPTSAPRNPVGYYRLSLFRVDGVARQAYRWEGWPAEYGWRMLRHIPSGVTVELPDEFFRRMETRPDATIWGYIGPHARTYPDGSVEFNGRRTTVLRREQWELVP